MSILHRSGRRRHKRTIHRIDLGMNMIDILYRPERQKYFSRKRNKGCPFCLRYRENNDEANLILHRGQTCYVMLNLHPYNTGHLLVIPYEHTGDLTKLSTRAACELISVTQTSLALLKTGMTLPSEGFTLGMNLGETSRGISNHLHLHIVPRWLGDTNFLSLIGGAKVIPELLTDTYAQLKPLFRDAFNEQR